MDQRLGYNTYIIKYTEEKHRQKALHNTDIGNIFENCTTRARETETKINKWNYNRLKSFYTAKEPIIKIKRQLNQMGEKICMSIQNLQRFHTTQQPENPV